MAPELHDVFRMRMRLEKIMPIEHFWTIRVYDDDEIHIEMEQCEPSAVTAPQPELQPTFFIKPSTERRLQSRSGDVPGEYSCSFFVTKTGSDGEVQTVSVKGYLCRQRSFQDAQRTWTQRVVRNSSGRLNDDEIESEEQSEAASKTIGTPCCKSKNGEVIGTLLHESWYAEPAEGRWSRSSLYFVDSNVDEDGAVATYHCDVTRHQIVGPCDAAPIESLVDDVDEWPAIQGRAPLTIQMTITDTRRRWSVADHAFYPDRFREAVRVCLLSRVSEEASASTMPSELWQRVFKFCGFEWFA